MKIMVAVPSSENAKLLAETTLRWAARAGYNMRIFIPDKSELEDYEDAVDHANYLWFADLPKSVIEVGTPPNEYAYAEHYDLLVILPDNLRKWNKNYTHDLNPYYYARDIGAARLSFSKNPDKQIEQFPNGATMQRVSDVRST